jgi:hypothetical protein
MFAPSRLLLWGNETLAIRVLRDGFVARVLRRILRRRLDKAMDESGSGFVVICKVEMRSRHHEFGANRQGEGANSGAGVALFFFTEQGPGERYWTFEIVRLRFVTYRTIVTESSSTT